MTYSHNSCNKVMAGSATSRVSRYGSGTNNHSVSITSTSCTPQSTICSTNKCSSPTKNNSNGNQMNCSTSSNGNGGGGGFFASRKVIQHHSPRTHGAWQCQMNSVNGRCTNGNNILTNSNSYQPNSTSTTRLTTKSRRNQPHHNHPQHQRSTGNGGIGNGRNGNGILSTLMPMNLTHFAGSKCFDAPAPTALPKPPQHWTSSVIINKDLEDFEDSVTTKICVGDVGRKTNMSCNKEMLKLSKRNLLDDFNTQNLKVMLNVHS